MITIITGNDSHEAKRVRDCIVAAGWRAEEAADIRHTGTAAKMVLAHVSTIDRGSRSGRLKCPVVAFGGPDDARHAVNVMRDGAVDYLPQGVDERVIKRCLQEHLEVADNPGCIARSRDRGAETADARDTDGLGIVEGAQSAPMRKILDVASRVAKSDVSVLISGESGTGKEVIARFIHAHSARCNGPFIAVNCAAVPEAMLEATLFGHEKGAFTGASDRRRGKFEIADGGTLLLDEITEMPIDLQAKLLRALQEREVERIGSHKPIPIDIRVLATTNRDVATLVSEGVMREDLYYRLSVFPLHLPPLRERGQDVLRLAEVFIRRHGNDAHIELLESARRLLLEYQWPGNVRELENCIQRALVLSETGEIHPADLGLSPGEHALAAAFSGNDANGLHGRLKATEAQVLLSTLANNNGARKATALELGISERTLRYKLKELRDRGVL